jgi:integrase
LQSILQLSYDIVILFSQQDLLQKDWEYFRMATLTRKVGTTGNVAYLCQVRIKGFKPAARTVRVTATVNEPAAKAQAEGWAAKLEKELREQAEAGATRRDITQMTIATLLDEYKKDPEVQQMGSWVNLVGLLKWWTDNYGTVRLLNVGVTMLREAREKLRTTATGRSHHKKTRAPGTVNRKLMALRSVWNWGHANGFIPQERVWPKKLMMKEPRGRVRYLSDAELARLLEASKADPVMRAAIVVALSTGIRRGELLRLQWKDLDFVGSKLTVHLSKNGDARTVYLTSETIEALKALKKLPVVSTTWVLMQANGKPLNRNPIETRWRKIRKAAALTDFHFHDLRHSCASFLAQNGSNLMQIGAQLGHRSLNVTLRYAHLVEGAPTPAHAAIDAKLRGSHASR